VETLLSGSTAPAAGIRGDFASDHEGVFIADVQLRLTELKDAGP
jgi:hypothetical protein